MGDTNAPLCLVEGTQNNFYRGKTILEEKKQTFSITVGHATTMHINGVSVGGKEI